MSRNPIYGHCRAGCEYEAVRRDDWENSISSVPLTADDNGRFTGEAIARYHVKAEAKEEVFCEADSWGGGMYCSQIAVVNCKAYYIVTTDAVHTFVCRDLQTTNVTEISSADNILGNMAICAVGENIYLFGGAGTSAYSNKVLKYDTGWGSLTELSVSLTAPMRCMACCEYDGLIYLFGGEYLTTYGDGAVTNKVEYIQIFDPSNLTLTLNTNISLPNSISRCSCAKGSDGIYIYGTDGIIWRYSPNENTITEIEQTLYDEVTSVACAAIGEKHYLFGGCKSDTITNVTTVQVFDTKTHTLERFSKELPVAIHGAGCCTAGDDIFIIGGSEVGINGTYTANDDRVFLYCFPSYNCSVIYNRIHSSGVYSSLIIPLAAYDDLRPYFEIEIYSTKYDASTGNITIAYSVNGVGRKLTLSAVGELTDADTETITIIGATEAYKINLYGGLYSPDVSKKKSVVLVDETTEKAYEIYISDGTLMMKESEG